MELIAEGEVLLFGVIHLGIGFWTQIEILYFGCLAITFPSFLPTPCPRGAIFVTTHLDLAAVHALRAHNSLSPGYPFPVPTTLLPPGRRLPTGSKC